MRGCISVSNWPPIALRRYCVALSLGPVRICCASLIVMSWMADRNNAFAFGVAASAARFRRVSRSAVRLFIPIADNALSIFCKF